MASSSPPSPVVHQQPPSSDPLDPPLGVPLLLPAPTPPPHQPPPPPSSRRLPPPCWTPDETSALIDAYRDKWYSLRRGNLRAAHWQDVADHVHRFCPNVTPPKTAVQCRHKMEKLRKRYRAELQRAKSIPHHRFSSSWVYFSKMDSMEKGADSNVSPPSANLISSVSPLAVAHDFVNDGFGDDDDDNNTTNHDDLDDEDYHASSFPKDSHRNGLRIRIAGSSRKNFGGFQETPNSNPNPNPNPNPNLNSRFGYKSSMSRYSEYGTPPQLEEGGRYAARGLRNGNNGAGSSSGMGMGMGVNMMKKKRSALGKRERKEEKGDKVATEMVEAIRVLGDGLVRMEMMKMEMMRENERVRMENEMKRTQMFLQSQQNLVQGFLKGWSDLIVNNNHNDDDDDGTNNTKDAS